MTYTPTGRLRATVDPFSGKPNLYDMQFPDGTSAPQLTFEQALAAIIDKVGWAEADARVFLEMACQVGGSVDAPAVIVVTTFGEPPPEPAPAAAPGGFGELPRELPEHGPDKFLIDRKDLLLLWSWAGEAFADFPPEKLPLEPWRSNCRERIIAIGEALATKYSRPQAQP